MFNPFKLIYGFYKDVSDYIYIIRTINKNKNNDKWNLYRLRHDYLYRIYTVVSLENEVYAEENMFVEKVKLQERLEPVYNFLEEINLHEITKPVVTKIEDSVSYLLVMKPIFSYINIINTMIIGLYVYITYLLVDNFNLVIQLFNYLKNI